MSSNTRCDTDSHLVRFGLARVRRPSGRDRDAPSRLPQPTGADIINLAATLLDVRHRCSATCWSTRFTSLVMLSKDRRHAPVLTGFILPIPLTW
ncbi:MAG: hypothetical protein ABIO17_13095 [Pseudoxanthomonas sp.]